MLFSVAPRNAINLLVIINPRVAFSQLHHAALHGAGGVPVLAPGQDALHRQEAAAGDHRQAAGRAPDILPRLQQRRRVPVSARQPRDAEG